ncbi:hypothetical protein HMPREF3034_02066 [Prevotella sp. DNF00663]|nr:hypothetical protein HMPREF3034_02066 [Prevotella sp. DNF00663]
MWKLVCPPTGEHLSDGANIDVFQAVFAPFLLSAYLWLRFGCLWLRCL